MNYKKEDLPNLVGREFRDPKDGDVLMIIAISTEEIAVRRGVQFDVWNVDGFTENYTELLPEIPEGFTRHFGGECPVSGKKAEIAFVDGTTDVNSKPECLHWNHDYEDFGVIAYRVIEQEKPKQLDISEYWQVVYESNDSIRTSHYCYKTREGAESYAGEYTDVIGYKQVGSNIVELV